MANHPLNLGIRFLLEIATLVAMGYWGFSQHSGLLQVALGIGIPLTAAILWGTFRVDGDPRSAPVPVRGVVRLTLEFAFFGTAIVMLYAAGAHGAALILLLVSGAHYLISYDRMVWLLRR